MHLQTLLNSILRSLLFLKRLQRLSVAVAPLPFTSGFNADVPLFRRSSQVDGGRPFPRAQPATFADEGACWINPDIV